MSRAPDALTCDVLVVHCMDFRLQEYLNAWCEAAFGRRNYDRLSVAGAVQDAELVLKHVALAERLHQIRKVVLVNHENCLAYGEAGTYKRQKADLAEVQRQIQALLPQMQVEKYYLRLDGTFERVE